MSRGRPLAFFGLEISKAKKMERQPIVEGGSIEPGGINRPIAR